MDGNRGKKLQYKCGTRCNEEVDRISQLPDDIIVGILSFLYVEKAAATSVLSTRWYNLWRYTPTLFFYNTKGMDANGEYIEWVNSVVESHKAQSLKEFALWSLLDKSDHCQITKWLEFAFSKRVEALTLRFDFKLGDNEEDAVVLDKLLRPRPSNLFQSSNLKSLWLMCLKVSGEDIKLILCGCRSLERLTIEGVVLTSDIEVCDGATGSLVLKHLKIYQCSGGKWIKVSAPNLVSFKFSGEEEWLLVENVPKLVKMAFEKPRLMQKIYCLSQLQILTIGPFGSQGMLTKDMIPTMPKLKEVMIIYFGRSKHLLPSLTYLLRASPLLQTFNIKYWEENYEFEENMEVETFVHHHLREFRFTVFDVDAVHHLELVTYILDNCVALRKIIITIRKIYRGLPDMETVRAKREAEKAKQLLQPKLPSHVHLQILIESDYLSFDYYFSC